MKLIIIKSGYDIYTGKPRDLLIAQGKIVEVGENISADGCTEIIDARGLVVSPGFIDVHGHFREPGFEHKETIVSGANAAKKGGFTTVVCMANTKPCVDNMDTLRFVLSEGRKTGINVLSVAAVTLGMQGRELSDMDGLADMGAAGFSDDGFAIMDEELLKRAMIAAKGVDLPLSLHEENPEMIDGAGINAGELAGHFGLLGAPRESEIMMVERDCKLALETGARVHIQHLSCARSVEAVRKAKAEGANITAEVTPQHFSLTQQAVTQKGTLAKLNPPFRTESDRQALIEGLKDGTIDMIATDHAPHSAEEKALPFLKAPSGVIGLETALALGITNLVRKGYLSLPELIEKMTTAPAKLYKLESGLEVGKNANLTIFNESEAFVVSEKFESKSKNSPFVGEKLYGKVKYTICNGKIVYRDGVYSEST